MKNKSEEYINYIKNSNDNFYIIQKIRKGYHIWNFDKNDKISFINKLMEFPKYKKITDYCYEI